MRTRKDKTMTKAIPTDKRGNVYYGPRTYAAASETIDEISESLRYQYELPTTEAARRIASVMDAAGYSGIANRIRKEWEVTR